MHCCKSLALKIVIRHVVHFFGCFCRKARAFLDSIGCKDTNIVAKIENRKVRPRQLNSKICQHINLHNDLIICWDATAPKSVGSSDCTKGKVV